MKKSILFTNSTKTLRVQLFNAIRDIPYVIDSEERDASCVAKTKLLGEILTRIGLQCQVMTCDVKWGNIGLPQAILRLAPRPVFSHFYLKVFIPETKQWVVADPTWDLGMRTAFPVNKWNGISDTKLAYSGNNLREATNSNGIPLTPFSIPFRNFDPNDEFTKGLNRWYVKNRRKKKL